MSAVAFTSYPDLDVLLGELLDGAQAALGDNFHGLYLHGSLARGDFDPQRSDVDFVVTTHERITPDEAARLQAFAEPLLQSGSPWTAKLEGAFMPLADFLDPDAPRPGYPCFDRGEWQPADDKEISNALQRSTLLEHGIVLAGPPPSTFIAPVGSHELRAEALRILHGWWEPQLTDPRRLHKRAYQAYAVLTMCRMLYTLATGEVASKPGAAQWASEHAPQWSELIARAQNWRKDDGVDDMQPALEFLRFVVESAR